MKLVRLRVKGDWDKTHKMFKRSINVRNNLNLDKYGKMGVAALKEATPKDTGKTSNSWTYKVVDSNGRISIEWTNTNSVDGVNIALILQYGHATRNGGYVQGLDYINPAMRSVFQNIADQAWKEVTGT